MAKIRLLVMDVDGTLTDGCIYMGAEGESMKAFHCHDGAGIRRILPAAGIIPAIITGRTSQIVANRARELRITRIYQGVEDKLPTLKALAEELGILPEEIAYIGDDINDLACMAYCGIVACPNDAARPIKAIADFVCPHDGGRGAVRDFIDWLAEKNAVC